MLDVVENPDGSFSFGRYDRNQAINDEIHVRIDRAERMARYGANPNEIRQFWNSDIDHLYRDLDDPEKHVISKALLEGVIDLTPEGVEKNKRLAAKIKKSKPEPVTKVIKPKEKEPIVANNPEELKNAVLSMGGSEAEARRESIQTRWATHFKRGKSVKVYHSPGSSPSFAVLYN